MTEPILSTPGSQAGVSPAGRSPSSRALRWLAVGLILGGCLVLADAAVTLVWQEPITALIATLRQNHLGGDLRRVERTFASPAETRAVAGIGDERRRIAFLASELERHSSSGSAVGRIVIPRIGASYVIVKGTDTGDLESGPGIYPETRFPGLGRTTAIAGHRTTYLAPFRHIDALGAGSVIELDMPYAHFVFAVQGKRVVEPTDVQAAVANVGYGRLVLSACTPLFSAEKRLLVYARLVRTVPEGAARRLPGDALPQPIEDSPAATGAHARRSLPRVLEAGQSTLAPTGV